LLKTYFKIKKRNFQLLEKNNNAKSTYLSEKSNTFESQPQDTCQSFAKEENKEQINSSIYSFESGTEMVKINKKLSKDVASKAKSDEEEKEISRDEIEISINDSNLYSQNRIPNNRQEQDNSGINLNSSSSSSRSRESKRNSRN